MAGNFFVSAIAQNYFPHIIPQVSWYKIAPLVLDLYFGRMPTQIQDVASMIVMSSWYDLGQKGQFKVFRDPWISVFILPVVTV